MSNVLSIPLRNLPTWIATNYYYQDVIIICRNPDRELYVINNDLSTADKERMFCGAIYMNQLDDLRYQKQE
jgi:hypothetical protein